MEYSKVQLELSNNNLHLIYAKLYVKCTFLPVADEKRLLNIILLWLRLNAMFLSINLVAYWIWFFWFLVQIDWISFIHCTLANNFFSNTKLFPLSFEKKLHIFQFWGCIEFQSWQMQDPSKNVWGEADSPFAPLLDAFDIMGTRMCTRRISMSSFITEWKFTWTL